LPRARQNKNSMPARCWIPRAALRGAQTFARTRRISRTSADGGWTSVDVRRMCAAVLDVRGASSGGAGRSAFRGGNTRMFGGQARPFDVRGGHWRTDSGLDVPQDRKALVRLASRVPLAQRAHAVHEGGWLVKDSAVRQGAGARPPKRSAAWCGGGVASRRQCRAGSRRAGLAQAQGWRRQAAAVCAGWLQDSGRCCCKTDERTVATARRSARAFSGGRARASTVRVIPMTQPSHARAAPLSQRMWAGRLGQIDVYGGGGGCVARRSARRIIAGEALVRKKLRLGGFILTGPSRRLLSLPCTAMAQSW